MDVVRHHWSEKWFYLPWSIRAFKSLRCKWILQVTQAVWSVLNWMDRNHLFVVSFFITSAGIHFILTIIMMIGIVTDRRILIIPWMISQLLMIILMTIVFITCIFFSFFIHLLVAVVFPIGAGIVLGLTMSCWKKVYCTNFSIKWKTLFQEIRASAEGIN